MPCGKILSLTEEQLGYQWTTEKGTPRRLGSLRWTDITSVSVFKRDLFAYDLICLQLSASEDDWVELDEEDPRWEELTKALPLHLPGCKPWEGWYGDVVCPAFAENLQCIYQRPGPAPTP